MAVMKKRTTRRRRDPSTQVPTGRPNRRSLPQFHREVVALLRAGHNIPSETGVRLVAKYGKFVRDSWVIRRPPCWVSDNLARKYKENRTSRDYENPAPGEVYQSRAGTQWEVTSVNRDKRRIKVKKTGFRDLGELEWNPIVLKQMKQLQVQLREQLVDDEGPRRFPIPTAEQNPSAFKAWLNSFKASRRPQNDLDGPNRRYYVYVIETVRQGKRVLYVGQSAHKPAERLKQHKKGVAYCHGCTERSYAKGAKMRLVPEFYKAIPTIRTRQKAEQVERLLARKLRSLGFKVEGGH